jgi:hypothetical protein
VNPVIQVASLAESKTSPAVPLLSTLLSSEFRRAYHHALDIADKIPRAQQAAARSILERYFGLEEIGPDAALNTGSFYFTERPIKVGGKYKFLLPGTVKNERIDGRLFLLRPKSGTLKRLIEAKEFDGAVSAVEAVRLTLMPERVNGIISFISDAKQFYGNRNAGGAEKAIGTALDHFNRAAIEGLRRIKSDAERGKRSNEAAGTRRTLADLRKKLQTELASQAEARQV